MPQHISRPGRRLPSGAVTTSQPLATAAHGMPLTQPSLNHRAMHTFDTSDVQTALRRLRQRAMVALVAMALLPSVFAQGAPVANPYDQTRSSSFTYRADGLLESETIEPGNPQLCVTTTYAYDAYGNKTGATTANCAGVSGRALFSPRTGSSNYAIAQTVVIAGASVSIPPGSFPITSTNALNQSETRTYDPRFGAALSITGPNALTTTWQVDDFGRKTKEIRADGTSSVIAYCYLVSRVADASSNSANCPSPSTAEIPADAVMFVHSEPHNASDAKNGPFSRVYSDRLGRRIRSVTEAFDGATQPGGANRLVVQDTDYNRYGAQVVSTQPYFLDTASSTSGGASNYGMTRTDYDVLGRPTAVYTTDATVTGNEGGSQPSVTFGSRDSRQAAMTKVTYNGLTTITTNDKGQTRAEEKNIDGKLVRVTNHLGAQLAHQHDAFGNLVATKDALQNTVTLSYDLRGRKVAMNDPDTGLWQYDYNALGEVVWQQSPNQRALAQGTTMAYDVLGRMTQRVEPEYTSAWSYDKYADGSACAKGVGKLCQSGTSNGIARKLVYDSLGRPINTRTTITNGPSFASAVSYDSAGRLATQTYPSGLQVAYSYTAKGFLSRLTLATAATVNPLPATPGGTPGPSISLAAGSVLWQAVAYNSWGKAEQQTYGNGVVNKAVFDAVTGRLTSATAGKATASDVFSHSYAWDSLDHLTGRTDANGAGDGNAVTDNFLYDGIGRLQSYTVAASALPNIARTVTLQYNALGNILSKSDVGTYTYGAQGAGQVRPHALQSVAGIFSASYTYDANGNLTAATAGKYRSIAYTSFNLPDSQTGIQGPAGTPKYTWQYDENHQRIKETRVSGGVTRVTWNLHPDNQGGLAFESESTAGGTPSNRHYLSVGGMSIGVLVSNAPLLTLTATQTAPTVLASITLVKVEYWHKDHLGSLAATTDHTGAVTARYAYDPFGKRRYTNGTYDAAGNLVIDWTTNTNNGTDRGYTGHEQLDDIGLVHMNGRVFDPTLGVFLQGDPMVQDPNNLQNFNRYGYCFNNPITCTDPSGFSFLGDFFGGLLMGADTTTVRHTFIPISDPNQRPYIAIAAAVFLGPAGGGAYSLLGVTNPLFQAAIAGFASGAISTGNLKGALQGSFSAAMFYGAGELISGNIGSIGKISNSYAQVAIHGVAGCVSSVAGGGKCGPGALSAAFSKAAVVNGYTSAANPIEGSIKSAILGGAGSVLGGGKFSNGAMTGSFSYLFNFLAHKRPLINPNGIGENSAYAIDFEQEIPSKDLGWFGKMLKWVGNDSLNLPLNVLAKGQDWTQSGICAVQTCYGSRDLPDDIRAQALGIEPQVKQMATNIASNNGWDLNYLGRDQLQTIVQSWSNIPNFTKLYGSSESIMNRFPIPKPPGQ